MPSAWGGGPCCRCPGVASCAFSSSCCKREPGLPPLRAYRNVDGNMVKPFVRCHGCVGQVHFERATRKRPAAAVGPPAAKAKAAAVPAAAAPAAAPQVAAPVPFASPDRTAEAAFALHAAALQANAVALSRNSAALESLAAAVREAGLAARGATASVAAEDGLAAPPAGPAAAGTLEPPCPRGLGPLRSAVEASLREHGRPAAKEVLLAAGLRLSAASFVKLRAVLAVYFPHDSRRVQGADLGPPRTSGAAGVERWLCQQQLAVLLADGWPAATLLSHVARTLCSDRGLCERHGARLLADACGLP